MNREKKLFYALLFLSGKAVASSKVREIIEPFDLENKLIEYVKNFNQLDIGLKIIKVADGYQMVVDSEIYEDCSEFFNFKRERLTKSAKETIAIIAYNQPVTKQEIDYIRGVNSTGVIKQLLDKNLITISGRKDVPGRPLLYSVTNEFYEYFGLNNISDLPTLREWQELKKE
jgi:segregation and condensation protein B